MTDILADYREWRSKQPERIGTHSDRCHVWERHERCMIHRLAAELEKTREYRDLAESDAALARLACDRLRNDAAGYTAGISSGGKAKEPLTGNTQDAAAMSPASAGSLAWVPVTERLPDHHGTVVCRTQDRQLVFGRVMTIGKWHDGELMETYHWRGYPDCPLAVTHWFPLPEPPADFK